MDIGTPAKYFNLHCQLERSKKNWEGQCDRKDLPYFPN